MSRFKKIPIWYDDHTRLTGSVARLPQSKLDYESFVVEVRIGGIFQDVTDAKSIQARLELYKRHYAIEVFDKYMEDLRQAPFGDHLESDFDGPAAS